MTEKSAREQLTETLRAATERVRQLPEWARAAISTELIFHVAPAQPVQPRGEPEPEPER
jgi:hypothetical protein